MAGKMFYKDAAGAGAPSGSSAKPAPDVGSGIPPKPTTAPPEGTEWQLQRGADGKIVWAAAIPWIAGAVGALASAYSARQANKPRTGYTDQTTTQSPYLADMIQPDLEAILSYQRSLINQGPTYVGPEATWPQHRAPQPGYAPGPVQSQVPRQYVHQPRPPEDIPPGYVPPPFQGGGPGNAGGRGGAEPWGDPGEMGNPENYLKSTASRRGDLGYLRALFASTGRG